MARTDSMYMRIDPKLKADAEAVLSRLGLTPNDAITVFFSQVVLQGGLPFEVKIPTLTREQAQEIFFAKIKEAEESAKFEKSLTIDELETRLGV